MPAPRVTFVIATYRRADALRCTLRALLQQTHAGWDALVIGDRCGPETEAAVRSIGDPRVRYYNLPRRFGEQSGPNSAGLHLAGGDFVCFLNQDDLLLKDHLARALERLDSTAAHLYFGRFANATGLERAAGGAVVPVFGEILPATQDLRVLVLRSQRAFDPSSFWVVRTSFARAVGPWRAAVTLRRRTPLVDWLLRAWRRGGVFCFGDTVTGIRMWTHNIPRGAAPGAPAYSGAAPAYGGAAPENEWMVERLSSEGPDDTRAFIERRLRPEPPARRPDSRVSFPRRLSRRYRSAWHGVRLRLFAGAYRRFGIDPVDVMALLTAHPKGAIMRGFTVRRLGEDLPPRPTIREFVADPEAHRIL